MTTSSAARAVLDEALAEMRWMMQRLKLTVNEEKTRVCQLPQERFDFLGYSFGRWYSSETGRAYLRYATVEEEPQHGSSGRSASAPHDNMTWQEAEELVSQINAKLIGWANYFSLGPVATHTIRSSGTPSSAAPVVMRLKHKVQNSGLERYPRRVSAREVGTCQSLPASRATFRGRKPDTLSESGMPEIGPSRSMSGMWKRSHGSSIATPPDERGGNG